MKNYVLAFVFTSDLKQVLLIHKTKPGHWQDKRINGLGGSVEAGETDCEASSREIREGSGLQIPPSDFSIVGTALFQSSSPSTEAGACVVLTTARLAPGEKTDVISSSEGIVFWSSTTQAIVHTSALPLYTVPAFVALALTYWTHESERPEAIPVLKFGRDSA